jgi:hypothetical protein
MLPKQTFRLEFMMDSTYGTHPLDCPLPWTVRECMAIDQKSLTRRLGIYGEIFYWLSEFMSLAFNFLLSLGFLCSNSTSIFQNNQRIAEIPPGHVLKESSVTLKVDCIHFIWLFSQFWPSLSYNKTLKNILYILLVLFFKKRLVGRQDATAYLKISHY